MIATLLCGRCADCRILAAAAMAVAMLLPGATLTAPAGAATRSARPTIGASVGIPQGSRGRVGTALLDSPANSAPCLFGAPSCESTNPTVVIYVTSTGDTSDCTFAARIDWGDGSPDTEVEQPGRPQAATWAIASHTYRAPGTYQGTENLSIVEGDCFANSGSFTFTLQRSGPSPEEQGAAPNPSEPPTTCSVGQPVNCATGTLWHTFTDVAVPGLGVPLNFSRTYSSADAGTDGPLGYGWSDSYGIRLDFGPSGEVDVVQENGSAVPFYEAIEGYVPGPGVQGSFVDNEDGTFTFTRFATNDAYVFAADGKLLSEVDPNGYETTLSYDGGGRLTEVADQAGRTLELAYDGDHISSLTNPKGYVTSFEYDQGDLVKATDPRGGSWEFAYDPSHRLIEMTDPNGGTTTNVYDGSDRVVEQENPLDQTTTWSYAGEPATASGGTTTITDPLGRGTVQRYVDLELREITIGSGGAEPATTSYEYDPIGHEVVQATTPEGNVSSAKYDERGDLLETVDPLGHASTYTYDSDGNMLSATDPRGATSTYSYDPGGNLLSGTTPLGGGRSATWTYEYGTGESAGELLAATNPNGETTAYEYDEAGNVARVVDPLGRSTSHAYDANGNLTASTNPSGRKTSYAYDAGDELTAIDYADAATPDVGFSYDAYGNRTGMDDGTGESAYTYDAAGRLTSATNGAGRTIAYAYDAGGELTEMTYPSGKTVTRGYDDRGQLASVTDWLGHTSEFEYDGDGNLVGRELPGSVTTTSSFEADGRVAKIDSSGKGGLLARFSYERDESGQVISSAESGLFTGSAQYGYDEGNRLTSVGGNVYSYDDAGNPTAFPDGRPQTFDLASQLLSSGSVPPPPGPTPVAARSQAASPRTAAVAAVRSSHRLRAHRILSTGLPRVRAGELLLAFVSAQAGARVGQAVRKLRAKGLSWRSVSAVSSKGETVGVWQARADRDLAGASISAELARKSDQAQLTVVAFEPGATVGAVARRAGRRGAPSLSIDAVAGGQVWAVGHLAGSTRLQPAAGSRVVEQTHSARPPAIAWVQQRAVASNGPVRLGGGARHAGAWSLAAVAVEPPSGAGTTDHGGRPIDSGGLGGYRSYSYNAQGGRSAVMADGGTVSFDYDQADRLIGIGGGVTYAYDGDGLRTAKTAAGSSTSFTWDPSGSLSLLVEEGSTSYVYGPDGKPLEQITGAAATYLLADQQGSTRLLTDSSGDVVGTYAYDAWGAPSAHSGASTSLQYDGEQADPESGLIYLRARYYDPSTGQFLTPDPRFAFDHTPYQYASDNPLAFSDPTGEFSWWIFGAAAALGACSYGVSWYLDYREEHSGEKCYAVPLGPGLKSLQVCPSKPGQTQAPEGSGGSTTFSKQ